MFWFYLDLIFVNWYVRENYVTAWSICIGIDILNKSMQFMNFIEGKLVLHCLTLLRDLFLVPYKMFDLENHHQTLDSLEHVYASWGLSISSFNQFKCSVSYLIQILFEFVFLFKQNKNCAINIYDTADCKRLDMSSSYVSSQTPKYNWNSFI